MVRIETGYLQATRQKMANDTKSRAELNFMVRRVEWEDVFVAYIALKVVLLISVHHDFHLYSTNAF